MVGNVSHSNFDECEKTLCWMKPISHNYNCFEYIIMDILKKEVIWDEEKTKMYTFVRGTCIFMLLRCLFLDLIRMQTLLAHINNHSIPMHPISNSIVMTICNKYINFSIHISFLLLFNVYIKRFPTCAATYNFCCMLIQEKKAIFM